MSIEEYAPEEVEAIVKRYEFLALHMSTMKIKFTGGGCDNEYPECCGVEALNDIIDECISIENHNNEDENEEEDEEEFQELKF